MRSALQLPMMMMRPPSSAALLHVLDGRLNRYKHSTHIDCNCAIEVFQAKLVDRRHQTDAGVVDEDIDAAEFLRGLVDGAGDGVRGHAVRLKGDCLYAEFPGGRRNSVRAIRLADIGQRDMDAFAGQTHDDGGANTAASSSDNGALVLQVHVYDRFSKRDAAAALPRLVYVPIGGSVIVSVV